jgi:hypothetical protein
MLREKRLVQDNKLNLEDLKSTIEEVRYSVVGQKTSVCALTLKNGFEVIGTSAPVDKKNFNEEIGKKIAYEKALNKLWETEGYRLQCAMFGDNLDYSKVNNDKT